MEFSGFKRITRNEAKNFFNNDIEIKIIPSKASPLEWSENWFKKSDNEGSFNFITKEAKKHLCNKENGLTLAYYKEV